MKTQLIFFGVLLIAELSLGQSHSYLEEVLANVSGIESATYYTTTEAWAPGDTVASRIYHHYVKEFNNPADTTIGASFAKLMKDDTTRAVYCYNGKLGAVIDWQKKQMQIDSFQNTRLPFRPIQAPFFNYVTSILRYAAYTKDPVRINMKALDNATYVEITIRGNKQVEFFGKPKYIDSPHPEGEISRYELWINKTNALPYRVRREMSHDITVITCNDIEVSQEKGAGLMVSDFLPADFPINKGRPISAHDSLIGKVAPAWNLKSGNQDITSLSTLNGKIVLIQFTSVSCGPCKLSIGFMNELKAEYDGTGDLDVISIESFNRNSKVLELYKVKHGINYPFLVSTEAVTKKYQIELVPMFFLLDSRRVIRKVITGYQKGTTDRQIRDAIKALL